MKKILFPSRLPAPFCDPVHPHPSCSSQKPSSIKSWCKANQDHQGHMLCAPLGKSDQYERSKHLPRLLHLFAQEADKLEREQPGILVKRLKKALRTERRRGQMGHWRYSLARHIGLHQALGAEQAMLDANTNA